MESLKCFRCGDKKLRRLKEEKADSFNYDGTKKKDAYIKPEDN